MRTLDIEPSNLQGKIAIPPSKSHTLRALLFGSLAQGRTCIYHYLRSPDTFSMIEAMRSFGAHIVLTSERIEITGVNGRLQSPDKVIDAGNSGLILRLVGSLAALLPTFTVITGDHSIRFNRPVLPLLSALSQLGALALSSRSEGGAPIIIRGPLKSGSATLSGQDSQPVSGLLIATSFLEGETHLEVTHPGEKPWIDLTLFWLKRLGGKVTHRNYEHYWITGPLCYEGFEITIPGDLSSLSFLLVAAIITRSALTIENVDLEDIQGDKKFVDLLIEMGAVFDIDMKKKTVHVKAISFPLKGVTVDANEMIDVVPILAVLGCFTAGKIEINNCEIARKKESDRLHVMTIELSKMGANIEERKEGLVITPGPLHGAKVNSHQDHRVAMALAVAALGAKGPSKVEGIDCIAKSFPSFVSDFQQLKSQWKVSA